jgi:hypothetical protein
MRAHRRGFLLITDPSLRLWLREDTTWNVEIGSEPFFTFVRNLFSKKSAYNPLVWTMFIGMTCPMKWKILNWYRIWMGTTFVVVSRMFKPVKLPGNTHFAGKESTRS